MAIHVFIDDDAGYIRWRGEHPHGYVVNAKRNPGSSYLKLHRSDCVHISILSSSRYTTWTAGEYCKVCAGSVTELEQWALESLTSQLERRCYCMN